MIKLIVFGAPRTKKNSMQIIRVRGMPRVIQSRAYRQYEADCLKQIDGRMRLMIEYPITLTCVYYMPTRRRVDLINLLEATCDILVKAEVLRDDNSNIVVSVDGSRVLYDKKNPRVEITIDSAKE